MFTLWTPPGEKSRKELVLPPSQNLLRAGHVPVECISFQARTMTAAALLRAFTAGASRCIEPDGIGASAVGPVVQKSQR